MRIPMGRHARALLSFGFALLAVGVFAAEAGRWGEPKQLVSLEEPALRESSGVMASRRTPGVYWTMGDNDNPAEIYAFDLQGNGLATFRVLGATNVDWEDGAAAPGTGEDAAIYLADFGDNNRKRSDCAIYRVWEPAVDKAKRGETGRTMIADKYPFAYPDGPRDAETLLCDPKSQDLYVVTKEDTGLSVIYRYPAPLARNRKVTLERMGTVKFSNPLSFRGRNVGKLATGGDISSDGSRIVVRTYTEAFEWDVEPGKTIAQTLMSKPERIEVPWVGQYEAICYSLDGKSLIMTGEGSPCPVWEVKRK